MIFFRAPEEVTEAEVVRLSRETKAVSNFRFDDLQQPTILDNVWERFGDEALNYCISPKDKFPTPNAIIAQYDNCEAWVFNDTQTQITFLVWVDSADEYIPVDYTSYEMTDTDFCTIEEISEAFERLITFISV